MDRPWEDRPTRSRLASRVDTRAGPITASGREPSEVAAHESGHWPVAGGANIKRLHDYRANRISNQGGLSSDLLLGMGVDAVETVAAGELDARLDTLAPD